MEREIDLDLTFTKSERYSAKSHKKDIQICKDLVYPDSVVEKVKNEKDGYVRQRIMRDARNGIY